MSGEFDQLKGRVKQAAGDLTDDKDMKREGQKDELAGKTKDKVDKVADKVREGVDALRDKADDKA